jgi:hypothetical protein
MVTKREQLIQELGKLKNAEATIVSTTPVKANVKSRITGNPTPSNLAKVVKYAVRKHVLIAAEYETVVNKLRFKEAGLIEKVKIFFKGGGFEAEGTYTVRLTENGAVLQHAEKGTKYLRVLYRTDIKHDDLVKPEYYDGDGSCVTENFKALQEEYFQKPSDSKKQDLEFPVRVQNFTLDHVKYIEVEGEVIWNELTQPMMRKLNLE